MREFGLCILVSYTFEVTVADFTSRKIEKKLKQSLI